MRVGTLLALLLLLLAGCGAIDTSPGASGFADTNLGSAGRSTGVVTTDGRIILDRELPPGRVPQRPF